MITISPRHNNDLNGRIKKPHESQFHVQKIPVKAQLATRPLGIMRLVRNARRNVLEIIPELATRQPMVSGRTFKRWHMVMDPPGLRRILRDRSEDYPKAEVAKNIVRPAIGDSLFVAEGHHWLRQRRAAASVFTSRSIRGLAPVMSAASRRLIERISLAAPTVLDMCEEVTTATFEVISNVTFADGVGMDRKMVHRAINAYLAGAARASILDIIGAPPWIPRLRSVLTDSAVRDMQRIAENVIEARRTSGQPELEDLHSMLAKRVDEESGQSMSADELRDNLLTFIVAGHETTALALSWSLYLLAFDQEVQTQARDEAKSALDNRVPGEGDIARLPLFRQIVQESMRLYPPAALLLRTSKIADEIGGREVLPGDTMVLPIYALHRNTCFWNDPDHFKPHRFADGKTVNSPAYLPFGTGPRACIGSGFAMQEAIIMLAALVSKFRFELVSGLEPDPVMILTLRPKGGVRLKVFPA